MLRITLELSATDAPENLQVITMPALWPLLKSKEPEAIFFLLVAVWLLVRLGYLPHILTS